MALSMFGSLTSEITMLGAAADCIHRCNATLEVAMIWFVAAPGNCKKLWFWDKLTATDHSQRESETAGYKYPRYHR